MADKIKKVSLDYCARILKKNELRECEKQEHRIKELTHEKVMTEADKDSYELCTTTYLMT